MKHKLNLIVEVDDFLPEDESSLVEIINNVNAFCRLKNSCNYKLNGLKFNFSLADVPFHIED